MESRIKSVISLLLIAIFIVTNSVFAAPGPRGNIFQKKTPKAGQQPSKADAIKKAAPKSNIKPARPAAKSKKEKESEKPKIVRADLLYPSQLSIPSEFGSVKEHWPHDNSQLQTPNSKLIIHIQDAHCNYEAQMNLAKMLEYLWLAHGVSLILVEGGSRSDSLSYMREYAPKEKRIEVADKYLKSGKICGENYLDIVEDYPIDVFGVEKPELYDANMNSFLKLDEIRDKDLVLLDNLRMAANALKPKLYPKQALDLEVKKKDYDDEKIKFKDYTEYLLSLAGADLTHKPSFIKKVIDFIKSILNFIKRIFSFGRQPVAALPAPTLKNMMLYDKALELEKRTDLKQTELERGKLLERLTKTLPQDKLKEVVAKTQQAKDEKIKQSKYYNYLKSLIPQKEDMAKTYPNLHNYIEYLNAFDAIDNEELFKELPVLEETVYKKLLAGTKDGQQLYFISKGIETFEGLIEIKITPDETRFYTENKNRFRVKEWKDFLLKQSGRFGLATNLNPESGVLDNHLAFVDSFYGVARQREEAFVENSLKAMDSRLPLSPLTDKVAYEPQNANAPKIAVLICGGYHTATLTELFKNKGVAYVVVAPNVTTATDKTLYRTVLKEVYTPMARPEAVAAPAAKPALPGLLRQQSEEGKK